MTMAKSLSPKGRLKRIVRELDLDDQNLQSVVVTMGEAIVLLRLQLEETRAEISELKRAKVRIEWP